MKGGKKERAPKIALSLKHVEQGQVSSKVAGSRSKTNRTKSELSSANISQIEEGIKFAQRKLRNAQSSQVTERRPPIDYQPYLAAGAQKSHRSRG